MRKISSWLIGTFIIYALGISWYIYYGADSGIPLAYKGTAADPATFMNSHQLELSYDYSRIKHILFFVTTPFEWLIFFFILATGLSVRFQKWAEAVSKRKFFQVAIYVFWLSVLSLVIMLPIQWIRFSISKYYGVAAATFESWIKDQLIDFWISYLFMAFIVIIVYTLIKKFPKKWWLYTWLLSVPFTLFMMFLQPVIIDPLYNDFYPIQDKKLEMQILQIAQDADIPAQHVYEVNMSEKTNALNAYVTGIGSNARIVLWDTTLAKLSDREVLVVMAHEIAHYVKKHIYVGIFGYLTISFFGFYFTSRIFNVVVKRWGKLLHIQSIKQLASLPLLLLIFSLLSFTISPFANAVSRYQEHTADVYAIETTGDKEAAITMFQKLTVSSLSEVNPPYIVKLFRYGHPTMLERINFIEQIKTENSIEILD